MKLSAMFAPKDMTEGTPWKRIIEFALPMLLGNIAQQLYNTVDSIVVGKYVGDNALAAVGSAAPIFSLLMVLFVGISTGAGIMVSQYFGAKDREKLSYTIGTCITLTAISSLIIMVLGVIIARPMLELLNTPESIIDWCHEYLNIIFIGITGSFYYNIFSGLLRGMGDSFSALVYLLVATVLNIVLDLWFVAGLNMGVAGVALATILAQFVSAALCLIQVLRMKESFDVTRATLRPRSTYVKQVMRLGLPSGLTQAVFSLSMIVVQSLTNSFGEAIIATNVIIMRVDGFAMMPVFSFGMALTTFTGQNIGAQKPERVVKGARDCMLMTLGVSIVMVALILVFGKYLMGLFTDTASLVELSNHMMRILALGYIAMGVSQCLSGVMRGAGDTMTPMWISIVTTIIIRIPIAYLMAYLTRSDEYPVGRPESLFVSLLISWLLGMVINWAAYRRGKWKTKGLTAGQM